MDWQALSTQWLKELGILLELDTLVFRDGACGLAFDDLWYITIIENEPDESWRIYGTWWDERDQMLKPAIVRELLALQSELMFDQGVCFSYDSHEQKWLLCHLFLPRQAKDINTLEQVLAQQLHLMQWCHRWLKEQQEMR